MGRQRRQRLRYSWVAGQAQRRIEAAKKMLVSPAQSEPILPRSRLFNRRAYHLLGQLAEDSGKRSPPTARFEPVHG
jgi:hypothetical protein